jgi:hypothetical protein
MSTSTIDPGDKSPAAIEKDVERTRAHVSGTLDALRDKLAPSHVVDEFVERVTEFARGSGGATFARNLGGAVRDNPLPILLIGAGVGWLMLSGGSSGHTERPHIAEPYRDPRRLPPPRQLPAEHDGHGSGVGSAIGKAAGAVSDAAARATSYVGDAASRVADAGANLVSGAKETGASATHGVATLGRSTTAATREGWSSASGVMQEHPLLVGLLGAVVGAALGAALPRTEAEDELLGEMSDAATARVSEFGRETADQVRTVASEHLQEAKDAAAEGYAKVKQHLDEGSVTGASEALGEALSNTTKAAAEGATGLKDEVKQRLETDGRPHHEDRKV